MKKMKKIEKMVAKYNTYATKHGYSTISVDYENKKIIGGYEFKNEDEGNFFHKVKTIYINGEIENRFEKIEKELSLI